MNLCVLLKLLRGWQNPLEFPGAQIEQKTTFLITPLRAIRFVVVITGLPVRIPVCESTRSGKRMQTGCPLQHSCRMSDGRMLG